MTECEAKTKWCPHMQNMRGPSARGDITKCIGSACMMFKMRYPFMSPDAQSQEVWCGLTERP